MFIEKSPYHIKTVSHEIKIEQKDDKPQNLSADEDFSFWGWFKGLVNPLQNLPLISGIYSSVNADNNESDRDLVQNSLGGFMYGGPIGAIAGFGNWVFNKLFDKTPTELALDLTGLSSFWKDNPKGDDNIVDFASNQGSNENKLYIQYANASKNNNPKKLVSVDKTPMKEEVNKIPSAPDVNIIANIKDAEDHNKSLPQSNNIADNNKNVEPRKLEPVENKFREINFSYPQWKPDAGKKIEENTNLLRNKYQELGKTEISSRLKINA